MASLEAEAKTLTDLLRSKEVKVVTRRQKKEMLIEFKDGTSLTVHATANGLEFSEEDDY